MSMEQIVAKAMLGEGGNSILKTDGYKFSMAQAGFPLREETFYLTLRRGGPFFIPFDLNEIVQNLLPEMPPTKEAAFLAANGYGMTSAMEAAIKGKVKVWCAPKGSWVMAKEPILTVTGPSFLVSWLEPLLIMLQYPIQCATAFKNGGRTFPVVCPDEQIILMWALIEAHGGLIPTDIDVPMDTDAYRERVYDNALKMVAAVGGDAHRLFEVGLRAATCMQQHMIALEEIKRAGIQKTSNVYGAWKLYMIPVGTTGHEHQERWGSDVAGFRAVADMRPEPPSFLFDTYDPINIGIPSALKVLRENPDRPCSFRFDSGDQDEQFIQILMGCIKDSETLSLVNLEPGTYTLKLIPNLIFEDGENDEKATKNEALLGKWDWPRERRMYGAGGFFISQPHPSSYNRDVVSACYKLCYSGGPRMKFSGTPGKESLPGKPVILRGNACEKLISLVAQEGEQIEGFTPLTLAAGMLGIPSATELSPLTKALMDRLTRELEDQLVSLELDPSQVGV